MFVKNELQSIISGNGSVRHGETIQAVNALLRGKKKAISGLEKGEFNKAKETQILKEVVSSQSLWFSQLDPGKYIGEGAEQIIYEFSDPDFILKFNRSVFYEYWEDYLNNLLIHNYFFPHLSYQLLGFYEINSILYSVVKQPFVKSTENTNLQNVREFLLANGFHHKKGNDYFHPEIGIILEDLHDENVLTSEGVLQFIDTVFYLTDQFYSESGLK